MRSELARVHNDVYIEDDDSRTITIPTDEGVQKLIQVGRSLDEAGIAIDDIGLRRPTLDDVFLALTGHHSEGAGDGSNAPAAPRRDA